MVGDCYLRMSGSPFRVDLRQAGADFAWEGKNSKPEKCLKTCTPSPPGRGGSPTTILALGQCQGGFGVLCRRSGWVRSGSELRGARRRSCAAGLCWAATIVITDCLLKLLEVPKEVLQFLDHEHSQTLSIRR